MPARLGDHQSSTLSERPEQLPHRYVEGERCLVEHDVVGGEAVVVLHPPEPVDDGLVADLDALGHTGRAGGEDDIGGSCPAAHRLLYQLPGIGKPAVVEPVFFEPLVSERALDEIVVVDHQSRADGVGDERAALVGLRRVDGNIRRAQGEHRIDRDQLGRPAVERDDDVIAPADARRTQRGREAPPQLIELPVCPLTVAELDRRGRRCLTDRCLETVEQVGGRRRERPQWTDAEVEEARTFAGKQQIDVADGSVELREDAIEEREEALEVAAQVGLVVEIGVAVQVDADPCARTRLVQIEPQIFEDARRQDVVVHARTDQLDGLVEEHDVHDRPERRGVGVLQTRVEADVLEPVALMSEHTGELELRLLHEAAHRQARHVAKPHGQHIREHARRTLDLCRGTSGHRKAENDIVGSRHPGEKRRESGAQQHRRRTVQRRCKTLDGLLASGIDLGCGDRIAGRKWNRCRLLSQRHSLW